MGQRIEELAVFVASSCWGDVAAPERQHFVPRLRPAQVTITLTDGNQAVRQVESHRGDFMRPFKESEICEKFRELAGTLLTQQGVTDAEHAVDNCEDWTDVSQFIKLLRRSGAAAFAA